jgi:membrane-associated phospholipid phosphatase
MTRRLPARLRPPPILLGAGFAAGGIALMLLAGALVDRWLVGFDRAVMLDLRAWRGPVWLREAARDLTALGSGTVLTSVVVAAAGLLVAMRHRVTALALIAAAWSGSLAVSWLKALVGRARPTLVEHWAYVDNASFPSGHAASSAVIYLTLAALGASVLRDRAARGYLIATAILLTGTIGATRVYLGVHWPSDVLAGWSFGTLWALGWWRATAFARASLRQS